MVIGRGSQHVLEIALRGHYPAMLMNGLDFERTSVHRVERLPKETLALFDGDHRLQKRKRALRGARVEANESEELPGEEEIRGILDPCRELLEGSADGGLFPRSKASRCHSFALAEAYRLQISSATKRSGGPCAMIRFMRRTALLCTLGLLLPLLIGSAGPETRPRIRDLGVEPGIFTPGPLNAITDVEGVRVGHRTLNRGESVRTGVTAILPHGGNLFQSKTPAAVYVGNGFGKAAGFLQIQELGNLETPIVLTSTLSVGMAVDSVVGWTLEQPGNQEVRSVNAVVGETNDGFLNDIRGRHVTSEDVRAAIAAARSGPVEEGSVGAGTGTMALGW